MITFAVEGGFTNQMRSLQIEPSGQARVEVSGRASSGELGAERVAEISAALRSSGLFTQERTYGAPTTGADLQRYAITFDGVTIVAYDTTVPPELSQAIGLLEQTLREVQG